MTSTKMTDKAKKWMIPSKARGLLAMALLCSYLVDSTVGSVVRRWPELMLLSVDIFESTPKDWTNDTDPQQVPCKWMHLLRQPSRDSWFILVISVGSHKLGRYPYAKMSAHGWQKQVFKGYTMEDLPSQWTAKKVFLTVSVHCVKDDSDGFWEHVFGKTCEIWRPAPNRVFY